MREKIINFWYKKQLPSFFKVFIPLEKIYIFFAKRKRKKIILLEKAVFTQAKIAAKSHWRLGEKSQKLAELHNLENTENAKNYWLLAEKTLATSFVGKSGERINLLQANRHLKAKIPLIVVGNLTLGGTGKTPIVASLTRFLQTQGLKVAIISRGYGGKAQEFAQEVKESSCTYEVGDEALMLFKETGANVFVDKIRARALDMAIKSGAQVIISDDGLQHFGIVAQIKILVVDGSRGFGNGRVLPLGPLREEPLEVLSSIDYILQNTGGALAEDENSSLALYLHKLNKNSQLAHKAIKFNFYLQGKAWQNGAGISLSASPFSRGHTLNALAAIGNPHRFFADLRSQGLNLIEHIYADHQKLTPKVLKAENNFDWVMTAKDAVKLTGALGEKHWVYKVEATFENKNNSLDFHTHILHRLKNLMI